VYADANSIGSAACPSTHASPANHSCSVRQIGQYERPKNTGMVRNCSGATAYWVWTLPPVSGQRIITTPILTSISIATHVASHSRTNDDTQWVLGSFAKRKIHAELVRRTGIHAAFCKGTRHLTAGAAMVPKRTNSQLGMPHLGMPKVRSCWAARGLVTLWANNEKQPGIESSGLISDH